MIDPDNILVEKHNKSNNINLIKVPEFETEVYNLDDDKDYKTYIKDCKATIRRSFEYRQMIKYLRENMGMDKCAFIQGVSNNDTFDIKIEIHHYPFTLEDIVEIVLKKRMYYNESLELQMVAKEVMELHYKLLIGLISLSETVHELVHSGKVFVPLDSALGRPDVFLLYYKPFCTTEQLDTFDRIEKYSKEKTNEIFNTKILEENRVSYKITDETYQLPEFNKISDAMINRIQTIKSNNYLLPSVNDEPEYAIEIDETLIKNKH